MSVNVVFLRPHHNHNHNHEPRAHTATTRLQSTGTFTVTFIVSRLDALGRRHQPCRRRQRDPEPAVVFDRGRHDGLDLLLLHRLQLHAAHLDLHGGARRGVGRQLEAVVPPPGRLTGTVWLPTAPCGMVRFSNCSGARCRHRDRNRRAGRRVLRARHAHDLAVEDLGVERLARLAPAGIGTSIAFARQDAALADNVDVELAVKLLAGRSG